jgi:RNA polymerase sigma-70 factor (ECF subfamily)
MNLDEAVLAVAQGNAEALKPIYDEFRVSVYSLALAILKNQPEAEDVLQETFIRVYEKAASYQSGTNLKAWISSIARNLAYDVLRRKRTKPTEPLKEEIVIRENDQTVLQRLELAEAFLQLDETERQIVVLRLVAGWRHAEISELLDIPAGTVRWKYRRSLSRLAKMIGGDESGAATVRL